MTLRLVNLPGPITLVPSERLIEQAGRLARDHPHLGLPADPGQLLAELNARPNGVAATFSEPQRGGDWSVLLYLRTCVVRLFLTKKYQDAYTIAAIAPIRIHDHHRLAQGCLLIRPFGWRIAYNVQTIPRPSDAYWSPLWAEWVRLGEELAARRAAPVVTQEQLALLGTLEDTIDAAERITTEAASSIPPFPYRDVTSTGERRHGTRSVYVFKIAGGPKPDEGAFVRVRGEPLLRGQVTRVGRDSITIRFDAPVDWTVFAAARQGELEITPSRVVFAKQREAVQLLRARQTHNTTLLPALVNHRVSRIPQTNAQPAEKLDPDQLDAFRMGLATPDIAVVLGPPGTGKTTVISQLARGAAIEQGERILITSHTNRAVDNVLSRLPRSLEVVRVGNEGSVTAEGQPYLLERRAAELRKRVVSGAARAMSGYDNLEDAKRWTAELAARVGDLTTSRDDHMRDGARIEAARRAAGGPAQVHVDELTAARDRHERLLDRHRRRCARRAGRLEWTRARTAWPILGAVFGLLVLLWGNRQATGEERVERLREAWSQVCDALSAAERELDAVTRDDPDVRAARQAVDDAVRRRETCRAAALKAAREARRIVAAVDVPPTVRDEGNPDVLERDIAHLLDWLHRIVPLLDARAKLLVEWHGEISSSVEQLYPELIRYADVIAATCIGTASRPELSGVTFDMAIVDEAGQIGVADALVPLVRARRGVLVGDDQQLPPFLDSEVEAWGAAVGDPEVRDLLARSALERLRAGLPGDHIVQLTRQRRMPEVIADFVSGAFYEGRLRTAVQRHHRDAVFGRPLAFVNTADLPARERAERQLRDRERWGQSGYVNQAEARLLIELAVYYQSVGLDWAVIVPYRAQTTKIAAALTRRIGDSDLAGLNVGTVDSFQGGEREVILYGFTRSNAQGRVGFLAELRRMNVAFTRSRRQLVLVGDLATLTEARDSRFRELARSLRDYAADRGEIRPYQEIYALVENLNQRAGSA